MKIIAGIIGGLIFAILCSFLIITAFAIEAEATIGTTIFFSTWAIGFLMALTASRAGKAWRRIFITSSICCFLAPIAGIFLTGSMVSTEPGVTAAETAGTIVGGGLVVGFLGFVGFFLGLVFLIVGLLVGRDREVVIVQSSVVE